MTAKELIEILEALPPETRVYEDRESELRELKFEDIDGAVSGEGAPFADEAEATDGPIVIFGAWA